MALRVDSIRWGRLAACVAVGLTIALFPPPTGLPVEGWRVFAVFTSIIAAFLLQPLDMAPAVLLGLVTIVATQTVDLDVVIKGGFGDSTVWLVVAAFLIADAVEGTGLGRRIALILLRWLGRSILGLAYAIAATELVLAPFIPSNTARGGGILAPIVRALAETLGSRPGESPRLAGAYLVQVGSHSNLVTSSMFLTAMAGNALLQDPAREILGVDLSYGTWLLGGIVPGLVSLALVPLLLKICERPPALDVTGVRVQVAAELAGLGPWSRAEKCLSGLLLAMLLVWSLAKPLEAQYGVVLKATTVALAGVCVVVVLRIRSWKELASCWQAWDALLWLGGFVAIADALGRTSFTSWFAGRMQSALGEIGPFEGTVALALVYFLSMFLFSQLTAHIAALGGAFFTVAAGIGSPPYLAVALIAYFSCLCGAMTPWSSGPVIIYFQQGYVSAGRWMRNGLLVAWVHLTVWLSLGLAWWKWLGWW